MKKIVFALVLGLVIGSASTAIATNEYIQATYQNFKIKIGDKEPVDVEAVVVDGKSHYHIRVIADLLGQEVGWDDPTRTITLNSIEPKQVEGGNKNMITNTREDLDPIIANAIDNVEVYNVKSNTLDFFEFTKVYLMEIDGEYYVDGRRVFSKYITNGVLTLPNTEPFDMKRPEFIYYTENYNKQDSHFYWSYDTYIKLSHFNIKHEIKDGVLWLELTQ